jgi:hypothetical protein
MTHTEYTLTVERPIYKIMGDTKAIHKNIGETVTLSQDDFERIKEGHHLSSSVTTGHGMTALVTFGKENFANEVTYTEVTIETGIAKLGKRKSK